MTETTFTIEASLPTDEQTALMSNAALGCYIRLMCFAWREGSVPENPALLARLCGETPMSFAAVWPQLAPCFESDIFRPGRLFHAGLERQREVAKAARSAKSAAGTIGAKKRWSQYKETVPLVASPSTARSTIPAPESQAPATRPAEDRAPVHTVEPPSAPASCDVDLFGPVPDDEVLPVPKDPNRLPPCPHLEIVALYHELLPLNPRTLTWNGSRKGYLVARWKEMATTKSELLGNGYQSVEDGLKWWRAFLDHCSKSLLLTGRAPARADHPPFVANLEWILRPNNFAKILEGNYHRGLPVT